MESDGECRHDDHERFRYVGHLFSSLPHDIGLRALQAAVELLAILAGGDEVVVA